jgi:hypothetical protein
MADEDVEDRRVDLGHGTKYSKLLDKDGNWVAIHEWHACAARKVPGLYGDGMTAGFVPFDTPEARAVTTDGPKWSVESWDPLTLSPSLACRSCSHHGFIRNGRWVPA